MQESIRFLFGVIVLALGFPIGDLLAHLTKDELKLGNKWFGLIIILSLLGTIIGLIIGNDTLLFSFAFIAIVTSRSVGKYKNKKKK